MSLQDAFQSLSEFLNSLDEEGEQAFELSHAVVIICPDCGKNVAFRNRCPKCGGDSWIPAGHAGGIFERMKAQRWREMAQEIDAPELEELSAPNGTGLGKAPAEEAARSRKTEDREEREPN